MYFFVYTPSNQHFKAFTVSKFYSETTFLDQLFKENSNFTLRFIVHNALKQNPCLLSTHLLNFIFPQDNFRCQTATSMATWHYMRT